MRAAMARGSSKKIKKGVKRSVDHTARLTGDILADIISRVPSKSACRCKCVSTRWRDLVSHPDYRNKMPQPLAGFFHKGRTYRGSFRPRHFTNVSGKGDPLVDASLPFLPKCWRLDVLDCCNGILLCRLWSLEPAEDGNFYYVVCNPATEKWVAVHDATEWSGDNDSLVEVRLGFDPAISSHFHVYEFIKEDFVSDTEDDEVSDCDIHAIKLVSTYSSKAGIWTQRSVADHNSFAIPSNPRSVFLNGVLYLAALGDMVLAVDVEGNDWWLFCNPDTQRHWYYAPPYNVFPSQGRLYLAQGNPCYRPSELSVWFLEDCSAGKWTLKHKVSNLQLFGADYPSLQEDYTVVSFHPEHDTIFMVCGYENVLVSYEMDYGKLSFIQELQWLCHVYDEERSERAPFLAYVPLLSESLADE